MKLKRKIILSIETAVDGGSISVIEGEEEIDFWKGFKEDLKAEDFLGEVSKILEKNKIEKKLIRLITVSNGPGNSTGVKIGLATARGLGTALNCEVAEVSLAKAILKFVNVDGSGNAFVVLPVGKNFFVLENIELINLNALESSKKSKAFTIEKLAEKLKLLSNTQIIVDRNTFENHNYSIFNFIDASNQLTVFEENMAFIIAKNRAP